MTGKNLLALALSVAAVCACGFPILPAGAAPANANTCETLVINPSDVRSVDAAGIVLAEDAGTIEILSVEAVSANCAHQILAFENGSYAMRDGTTLTKPSGSNQAIPEGAKLDADDLLTKVPQGFSADGDFIVADRVSYRRMDDRLITQYIGLWRSSEGSQLYGFTVDESGKASPLKPVLSSKKAIQSVSYFPMPDTRSGTLNLAMSDGSLVTLQWRHPGFF